MTSTMVCSSLLQKEEVLVTMEAKVIIIVPMVARGQKELGTGYIKALHMGGKETGVQGVLLSLVKLFTFLCFCGMGLMIMLL